MFCLIGVIFMQFFSFTGEFHGIYSGFSGWRVEPAENGGRNLNLM